MTEKSPPSTPIPAPALVPRGTGASGEHPAVKFMRAKLESINDHELEDMKKLNERLVKATTPAPKDPRREGDSDPPIDIVEVAPDPFPSDPPPHDKE